MHNTRTGKIARLPKQVRHQLNRRLEDGEQGKQLVEWLNGLPAVQDLLHRQFAGRPITEQNLSEWKQGGYREWLHHQESCNLVQRLAEQAQDLQAVPGDLSVSDRLSTLLAVELVRVAEALLQQTTEPRERWQRLRELLQTLGQLRRRDHQAARLRHDQQRWEREARTVEAQEHERATTEIKRRACAPIWAQMQVLALAPVFGGGELGRKVAAFLLEIQEELPPGTLSGEPPASTPSPSLHPLTPSPGHTPVPSDPIKPNPSKSN